jgi:hypothetical protein
MISVFGLHRRLRQVSAIVLLSFAASCSTWRPQPGVGLARPESEPLGHARVFLRDSTMLDLEDATISSDSVVGFGGATHTRFALARSGVASVEIRRTDSALTFIAGVLASVLLLALTVRG